MSHTSYSPGISRSQLNGMVSDFIAKGGEARRYPRGFTSDWMYLQSLMAKFGYELRLDRGSYILRPVTAKGRTKRLHRAEFLKAIDTVLAENGMQPFLRRMHP